MKGKGSWLGNKPSGEQTLTTAVQQEQPFKVSHWAVEGNTTSSVGGGFAPIQKSAQEQKLEQGGRKEQEFVFVSKK